MMYLLRFGWVDKDQAAWPACLIPMQLCVRRCFFFTLSEFIHLPQQPRSQGLS